MSQFDKGISGFDGCSPVFLFLLPTANSLEFYSETLNGFFPIPLGTVCKPSLAWLGLGLGTGQAGERRWVPAISNPQNCVCYLRKGSGFLANCKNT
jgi:hypothetical protein